MKIRPADLRAEEKPTLRSTYLMSGVGAFAVTTPSIPVGYADEKDAIPPFSLLPIHALESSS